MIQDFTALYKKIEYKFCDEKLLQEALTHPSFSQENKNRQNLLNLLILNFLKYDQNTQKKVVISFSTFY